MVQSTKKKTGRGTGQNAEEPGARAKQAAFQGCVGGRQEEKGMTEDEMAGWHHRLDGHEFG